MSMDMHEEDSRLIPKEVIVQSGDLNAVFKEPRHDFIYLALGEDEVTHNDVFATITFLHGEPAPESEGSRDSITGNLHCQVIPRNVHLQYIRFVVAFLTDDLQHLLVVARDLLGSREVSE